MEIKVTFPGNKRVDAEFDGMVVKTDQPVLAGGDGSAPSPFNLFLASLATCAGIYVLGFCQNRGLPTAGIRLLQRHDYVQVAGRDRLSRIELSIEVPPEFPEKYRDALVKVAGNCAVKKVLGDPPAFEIKTMLSPAPVRSRLP